MIVEKRELKLANPFCTVISSHLSIYLIHPCKMSIYEQNYLTFTSQILILMHQQQTAYENIVGKGEIARYEQFLLFPQCFQLDQIIVSPFGHVFDIESLFDTELEQPKIGILGKGLTDKDIHIKTIIYTTYRDKDKIG